MGQKVMTREEAIKQIEAFRTCMIVDDAEPYVVEALNMAIKALEKEPKTEHWIEKNGFDGDTYYDCSECGESFCLIDGTPTDNLYNHCPNCGAKMLEVEG